MTERGAVAGFDRACSAAWRQGVLPALAVLAALGLVACQSTPTADDAPDEPTSAEAPPAGDEADADDPLAQDADDFARRIDERLGDAAGTDPAEDEVRWAPTLPSMAERIDPRLPAGRPAIPDTSPEDPDIPAEPAPDPVADSDAGDAESATAGPAPPPTAQQLAAQLARRLRAEAGEGDAGALSPHHLFGPALAILDPRLALTEADLSNLAPDDRTALLAYQRFFTQLGEPDEEGADGGERLGLAADRLARRLADLRPLRIRNAHLCKRVNGFGVYTPFESHSFLAGREHPVIVYAELDDFATDLGSDGRHTVRLTQEIVLYNDSDGLAVWRVQPTEITDQSLNRRRDFFIVQVVRLPARLTVGKYTLKVTVTDEVGHAVDEATLPLRIVADADLARRGAE